VTSKLKEKIPLIRRIVLFLSVDSFSSRDKFISSSTKGTTTSSKKRLLTNEDYFDESDHDDEWMNDFSHDSFKSNVD